MWIVGRSMVVWPVADLPNLVNKDLDCVVQINPTITLINAVATYNLSGKAGEILLEPSNYLLGHRVHVN
jgi:NAD-dependent SIR2 family protein deacetylase